VARLALCFPGQGSQAAGMASGLTATDLGQRLLAVAAAAGMDLAAGLAGSDDELRPTEVAQPTLVFTELVLSAALPEELEVVAVAGHSVGELSACAAAGALDPEDALRLSLERGRLMAAMREGTMAAVLGLDADRVAAICAGTAGGVVIANLNAPGQVVISGATAAVATASRAATEAGARRVLPLRVSGAFHSPLMEEAAPAFGALLDAVPLRDARIPVVANVDGAAVRKAGEIRERLRRQLASAVHWTESVERMVALGADTLVEIGPGSVLTGLARRIAPEVFSLSVGTVEEVSELAERLDAGTGSPSGRGRSRATSGADASGDR
jgi:[acyl-carrier-protein] S-malonyltransferase